MNMNRLAHLSPASFDEERPSRDEERASRAWWARRRSRRQALRCAWQGLQDAWETQSNLRLHGYAAIGVTALGLWTHLAVIEWLWVSFAIGLVIFAEMMNTAIEQTVDLVVGLRPDPLARQVKDISAGCVLVAVAIAAAIGALTFAPHLLRG